MKKKLIILMCGFSYYICRNNDGFCKKVWEHIPKRNDTKVLRLGMGAYHLLAKLYAEHPKEFPREKLQWAVRMVKEKEAKVESTAVRQMREEVKGLLNEN